MNQYCEMCSCRHCAAKRVIHTDLYALLPSEAVYKLAYDDNLRAKVLEILKKGQEK